jgi:hypothetical protein
MFYANDKIGAAHVDPPFLNSLRVAHLHVESEPRAGSYTRRKPLVTCLSALQILPRVLHELVDPNAHNQAQATPLKHNPFLLSDPSGQLHLVF